jgi:hypothetical protein
MARDEQLTLRFIIGDSEEQLEQLFLGITEMYGQFKPISVYPRDDGKIIAWFMAKPYHVVRGKKDAIIKKPNRS